MMKNHCFKLFTVIAIHNRRIFFYQLFIHEKNQNCNLVIKKLDCNLYHPFRFFFGNSLFSSSLSFNFNSNGNFSPLNNFPIISLLSVHLISKPDSTLLRPASLLRNRKTSIMLRLLKNYSEIITKTGLKPMIKVFLSNKTLPGMQF